ncbi:hypothetical protein BDR05DRAFT_1005559 [Suillus weaverae]|nr:hypothetical protein BDR05DRAFT_1005559 [Suillus weaverae]
MSSSRVATTDQSTDYVPSDYNTQAGPSSSSYIDQTLSTYGHNSYNAQAGPSSSTYTDQTLNPPDHNNYNIHADYAPPFNYNNYNARDNPYGTLEGLYNHPRYPNDLSSFDNMSGTAPNPHHIQVPQLFDDNEAELSPEARYDPITTGEIPESQVIHLHFTTGLAGTITKSVLLEQGRETLTTPRLSPEASSSTFDNICSDMNNLSAKEKADLDEWKYHMVICGVSQQRTKAELSDFDLTSDITDE